MARHAKNTTATYSQSQNTANLPIASSSAYEEYQKYNRESWQTQNEAQNAFVPALGPKKHRKWPKVVATLAVIVALIGLGVGGYIFFLDQALSGSTSDEEPIRAQLSDRKSGEPYYILLLGSDARENINEDGTIEVISEYERSDVMVLVRVDEANKKISMLSIPRDTPVVIDGEVQKINQAYGIGGAAKAVETVSSFTGIPIAHYAELHISDFEAIVDSVGGIDFDVPVFTGVRDTITGEGITIDPGFQHINGKQAQIMARSRHDYENSDADRQNVVRDLVVAIAKAALDKPVTEIPGTVMGIAQHISTDMKSLDLAMLGVTFGTDLDKLEIASGSGPTAGGIRSDLGDNWYCYDNPEGWAEVIKVFTEGGDPSTVDANAYAIIPDDSIVEESSDEPVE